MEITNKLGYLKIRIRNNLYQNNIMTRKKLTLEEILKI